MSTSAAPGPHGLFYVDRDAAHAYLLSDTTLPSLAGIDLAVLLTLAGSMGSHATRTIYEARRDPAAYADHERAAPVQPDPGIPNLIGAPFGLYYVTLAGTMYAVHGPGILPLDRLDHALLGGYLRHTIDSIRAQKEAAR